MKKMKAFLPAVFVSILTIQMSGFTNSVNAAINPIIIAEYKTGMEEGQIAGAELVQEKTTVQRNPAAVEPSAMNISVWIFMSWTFFLILISIPFYFNHRRIKVRQQIISNLIEKGQEIPKELITHPTVPGRSDFHKGIILIALGIGIIIVLLSLKISNNYWTAGFIPLLMGIAYLISFKFDVTKK